MSGGERAGVVVAPSREVARRALEELPGVAGLLWVHPASRGSAAAEAAAAANKALQRLQAAAHAFDAFAAIAAAKSGADDAATAVRRLRETESGEAIVGAGRALWRLASVDVAPVMVVIAQFLITPTQSPGAVGTACWWLGAVGVFAAPADTRQDQDGNVDGLGVGFAIEAAVSAATTTRVELGWRGGLPDGIQLADGSAPGVVPDGDPVRRAARALRRRFVALVEG